MLNPDVHQPIEKHVLASPLEQSRKDVTRFDLALSLLSNTAHYLSKVNLIAGLIGVVISTVIRSITNSYEALQMGWTRILEINAHYSVERKRIAMERKIQEQAVDSDTVISWYVKHITDNMERYKPVDLAPELLQIYARQILTTLLPQFQMQQDDKRDEPNES